MPLEEVTLVEPAVQTPIVNPPVESPKVEVPKVEQKSEKSDEAEENPGVMALVEKVTGGVTLLSMAMGAVGVVGTMVIPKLVKWNTGWKDLVATAITGALGGFVLGKISKPAAVAFIIAAGGVFVLKAVRFIMNFVKTGKIGAQESLFGEDDDELLSEDDELLSDNIYDVGLFEADTATDRIIPTSGTMDDFY